jgi:RimJ/RimL family protein N-acetyltransferase
MRAGTEVYLALRLQDSLPFGMAGLHHVGASEPEIEIWIRESQRGHSYGREAVAAVISFAACRLAKVAVVYPVSRAVA